MHRQIITTSETRIALDTPHVPDISAELLDRMLDASIPEPEYPSDSILPLHSGEETPAAGRRIPRTGFILDASGSLPRIKVPEVAERIYKTTL